MGNIIGESYYYFKYFARNKIKAKNDASDWVYEHYVKRPHTPVRAPDFSRRTSRCSRALIPS